MTAEGKPGAAAGLSLKCAVCDAHLRSTAEAQAHAETTGHADFAESSEAVRAFVCDDCGKPCRSATEQQLHSQRTGHLSFTDRTAEAAAPLRLEGLQGGEGGGQAAGGGAGLSGSAEQQLQAEAPGSGPLVAPAVSAPLLAELTAMGFGRERSVRALHFSGNSGVEQAVAWLAEHEEDPDIDAALLVPAGAEGSRKAALTPEEARRVAEELREKARRKREEDEKQREREREKERIRAGKELLVAKQREEEEERKRRIELRKREKEEEQRARQKILQRLEEDKAERRRRLGLPPADAAGASAVSAAGSATEPLQEAGGQVASEAPPAGPAKTAVLKEGFVATKPALLADKMRAALRELKQAHKEEEGKVKMAFETMLKYVGNALRNPQDLKFRRIRVGNAAFQEKVAVFPESLSFLQLAGFLPDETGEHLVLKDANDSHAKKLEVAAAELSSAISNPFFGVL